MRYFFTLFAIVFLLTSCNNNEDRSSKLIRDGIQKLYAAEFEEAMEIFQKSAKLNPKNPEAWFYIGAMYQNKQDFNTAIEYYSKAIDLKNDYADAYYNRGQCWFYLGDRNNSCDDWLLAENYGRENLNELLGKCN